MNRNGQGVSLSKDLLIKRFEIGEYVRIDITDTDDPDFDRYHRRTGEVVEVIEDDAGEHTSDERDSYLFAINFENGDREHFRWRDLRPASDR